MTDHNVESIAKQFRAGGKFVKAQSYGSGHINSTFVVTFDEGGKQVRYILQQINHNVFKNPVAVMENIVRVTEHIRKKLQAAGASDISRRVLTVINSCDDAAFYKDSDGNYWRMYIFIENIKVYDTIETSEQAYEAARVFGRFQKMLVDLPGPAVHETIADFHNTPKRFERFQQALKADVCRRARDVSGEIEFVLKHSHICNVLLDLAEKGQAPVRITHNDTKINNVLFDVDTNEGLCVIDLDTVMPGLTLYDFGDMVRTAACAAEEDERDLSKVTMQMPLFEALVRGFLEETAELLTPDERQHLAFAGKLLTFEQATRFLTDYLEGDLYYKIHRERHNLDRCRTQLKLLEQMFEQEDKMAEMVESI